MKKLAFITALVATSLVANAIPNNSNDYLTAEKSEVVVTSEKIAPFYIAIVKGDFETVKKLIEMGQNVNGRASNGLTPLMFAARYNKVDILNLLIEKGADLRAKNERNGFTALKYAELSNAEAAYRILEKALGV